MQASPPRKGTFVFKNVHVIPMNLETDLSGQDVIVVDRLIREVVTTGTTKYPPDASIIDGNGRYVIPGLVDAHVHLLDEKGLQLFLMAGVTSVRVMEGRPEHMQWRNRIEMGQLAGPHLAVSTPILYREESERFHFVSTPEQARSDVRGFKEAGYDWIKTLRLDKDVFVALMDEAKKQGIPVGGHNPNFELDQYYGEEIHGAHEQAIPLNEVLASGMSSLEHINEVGIAGMNGKLDPDRIPDLAKQVKKSGIIVTPTIYAGIVWNEMLLKEERFLDPDRRAKIKKYLGPEKLARAESFLSKVLKTYDERKKKLQTNDVAFQLKLLEELSKVGVPLVTGSDTGGFSSIAGFSLQDEVEAFVQAGLTPYEALRCATYNGAILLGKQSRGGTVEKGKDADFVLLRDNPLQDIGAIRSVEGVMIGGRWLSADDLKKMDESFAP